METRSLSVVVLAEDLYEDLELHYPRLRLIEAGCRVVVAGTGKETCKGKWGYPVRPDARVEDLRAEDFDGVVVPGGYAPDLLRRHPPAIAFVRRMDELGRVVAAICHGPWVPISAGIVRGRTATCFSAIRDDLVNAGAEVVDRPVVVDRNLVTSRVPADLPDFCREILRLLGRLS